jgi:hypothetical protein
MLKTVQILRVINKIRWRHYLSRKNLKRVIVIIVVPGLEHLCVPSVRLLSSSFDIVVVNNGLTSMSVQWLSSALPDIHFFTIISSLRGRYTLSHGDALDLLSRSPIDIIYVDPDCYVFEPKLISRVYAHLKRNAIVSLFSDPATILGFRVPDTFCFGLQSKAISFLRKAFSLRIGLTSNLSTPLLELAIQRWGKPVPFPHPGKTYFDTIHSLAIAAHLAGKGIHIIPYSQGQIYHVLGTSYRINQYQFPDTEVDLTALNAHYFHCLVAEEFVMAVPSDDINCLIHHYGGSKGILASFPEYAQSQQRHTTDELFNKLHESQTFLAERPKKRSVMLSYG